jgi:hypothetical protein
VTTGVVLVASLAAMLAGVPYVQIRSTLARRNAADRSGSAGSPEISNVSNS